MAVRPWESNSTLRVERLLQRSVDLLVEQPRRAHGDGFGLLGASLASSALFAFAALPVQPLPLLFGIALVIKRKPPPQHALPRRLADGEARPMLRLVEAMLQASIAQS